MEIKRVILAAFVIAAGLVLSACGPGQAFGPTLTPTPTNTPRPTNTPMPTATLMPTNTPIPTNTPMPTTGSVKIKVFRSDTNESIANAQLSLYDSQNLETKYTTDDQGLFTLTGLEPDTYYFIIAAFFDKSAHTPCHPASFYNAKPNVPDVLVIMPPAEAKDGNLVMIVTGVPFIVKAGEVIEQNFDLVCK